MNVIQIEFLDLAKMTATVIVALLSAGWLLVTLIVNQFTTRLDERFQSQDELRKQREIALDEKFRKIESHIKAEGEGWRQIERDLLELRAALPLQYVRREDAIRQEVIIHSKLDALAAKIDALRAGG